MLTRPGVRSDAADVLVRLRGRRVPAPDLLDEAVVDEEPAVRDLRPRVVHRDDVGVREERPHGRILSWRASRGRERGLLAGVAALTAVTAALEYAGASDVAVFLVAAAALAGLAWVVSFATEAIGERFGPALTGVLQSTLGNLPELFVVLFAISAGELVVAQYSVLGSIFANALLVLGLVLDGRGTARAAASCASTDGLANDTATLLLLAVFIIALLGLSNNVGDRASRAPGGHLRDRGGRPARRLRGLARLVPPGRTRAASAARPRESRSGSRSGSWP